MKRKMLLIGMLLTLSLLAVSILFISSQDSSDNTGDFDRNFQQDALGSPKTLDVQYNSYYLAGATSSQTYLGNVTAPLHFLIVDKDLTTTKSFGVEISESIKPKATQMIIDSPYFYMTDLLSYSIFRGTLENPKANRFMYDSASFAECVPVSPTTFVIRTFASHANEYLLARETSYAPHLIRFPGLLEKQIDGLFCTDGMLHYSKELNRLVYLYFYRNQFICMDTSLNLLYRGNTIDTISHAKIDIVKIKSEKSITMGSPPLIVNKKSSVSGDWLFVHSNIRGRNEERGKFNDASVIDVYNLLDGEYKFSFYLPDIEAKEIRGFMVTDDRLMAVYSHYLLSYPMRPEFFKKDKQRPKI